MTSARQFFASLRIILAISPVDSIVAAIRDGIRRNVKDPSVFNRLDEWAGLSRFRKKIGEAIWKTGRETRLDVQDEISQQVAFVLMTSDSAYRTKTMTAFRSIEDMERYFYWVVRNNVAWKIREMTNYQDRFVPIQDVNPTREEFVREDYRVEGKEMDKMLRDFRKYVTQHARDDLSRAVFIQWCKAVDDKGADDVIMDHDVYPALKNKAAPKTLAEKWPSLRKLMVKFFEEQQDIRISDDLKSKLRVAQSLTVEFFRKRMAAWVLGYR